MSDKTLIKNTDSGIRFVFYKTDRFKDTRISVKLAVPLRKDTVNATALVPALLKHSCKKYPQNDMLEKRLAYLYGATLTAGTEKYADAQVVSLTVNSIADRFALSGEKISKLSAQLLCEVLFNPNFDKNGLFKADNCELEKRLQVEQIESIINDKINYARFRLTQEMFKGTAYALGAKGDVQGVKALTPAKITECYHNLLKTARVQITVIGDVDSEEIETLFCNKFDLLSAYRETIKWENTLEDRPLNTVNEELPLSQGKLCLGYRVSGKNIFADRVMCDMFGGGVYSKLFRIVREKMSLCYYCSSRVIRLKNYMFVQSGIENENRDKAVDAINAQLESMKKGDFSDEDFASSIRALDDAYSGIKDTAFELDVWYSSQMLDDEVISAEDYKAGIDSVTSEDIVNSAVGVQLDTIYTLIGTAKEDAQ